MLLIRKCSKSLIYYRRYHILVEQKSPIFTMSIFICFAGPKKTYISDIVYYNYC